MTPQKLHYKSVHILKLALDKRTDLAAAEPAMPELSISMLAHHTIGTCLVVVELTKTKKLFPDATN